MILESNDTMADLSRKKKEISIFSLSEHPDLFYSYEDPKY
jgi:hypothetical protein